MSRPPEAGAGSVLWTQRGAQLCSGCRNNSKGPCSAWGDGALPRPLSSAQPEHPFSPAHLLLAAPGGGQDRILPGGDLRALLAAAPPQPHPQEDHLRPDGPQQMRTAQVGAPANVLLVELPSKKFQAAFLDGFAPQEGIEKGGGGPQEKRKFNSETSL